MIVRSVKIWEDASGHFSAAVVLRPSALELSARDRDTRDRMVIAGRLAAMGYVTMAMGMARITRTGRDALSRALS